MSYYRVELIDYSEYNWNIDVFYKNQYIDSLNREEFQKLIGMLAISTWIFDRKYDRTFHPDRCELTHPFEVNAHIYTAQKLTSLSVLLNNQYDTELEAWMKSTLAREKEQYEVFKQASNEEKFDQYFNSLNEENTLRFALEDLNVEKIVDLKFIRNIELIYDEYLNLMKKESDEIVVRSGRVNNSYSSRFQRAFKFRQKYDNILRNISDIQKSTVV